MGNIQTGTICPYPFTFQSDNDTTLESCTKTYGEALDPGLLVVQVVFLIAFSSSYIPFVYRIISLLKYCSATKSRFFDTTQSKLYLAGIAISTAEVVALIDPLGFRNIITPYVYFISDEVAAASLFLLALLVVDFYLSTAQRANFKKGLPTFVLVAGAILSYSNFVGFQTLAVVFTDIAGIFVALKLFGAATLLIIYGSISFWARTKILEVLSKSNSNSDTSLLASLALRYPADLSGTDKTILTTKRKFCEYFSIIAVGIVFTFIFALLDLDVFAEEKDYQLAYRLEDQITPEFYVFKVLYFVAIILVLRLFKVPRVGKLGSISRQGSKSETGSGNLITNVQTKSEKGTSDMEAQI